MNGHQPRAWPRALAGFIQQRGSKLPTVGCFSGEGSSTVSPLTPGDLLIALHNIDSNKCDMKSIIKGQVLT